MHTTKTKARLARIVLFVLSIGWCAATPHAEEPEKTICEEDASQDGVRIVDGDDGQWCVRVYTADELNGARQLVIHREGVLVLNELIGEHVWVTGNEYFTLPLPDAKLLGDESLVLVVKRYSGGAHCCSSYDFYRLDTQVQKLQTIEVTHSDITFTNLDDKPGLELEFLDFTFAYWFTNYAESPAPRVVLKYDGERFRMAPDLMQRPAFTAAERELLGARLAAHFAEALLEFEPEELAETTIIPPVAVWETMLDRIYAGQIGDAEAMLERDWPADLPGKQEFRALFYPQLRKSPYWPEIAKMNGLGRQGASASAQ